MTWDDWSAIESAQRKADREDAERLAAEMLQSPSEPVGATETPETAPSGTWTPPATSPSPGTPPLAPRLRALAAYLRQRLSEDGDSDA